MRAVAVASSTARCRAGGEPMAGMAEAEAAQWLVVRLRGVLYTAEAHSSGVGHKPGWRPQRAPECTVARQCAKNRLVTYQLKGLANRTYVPRTISRKENEAARRSQAVKRLGYRGLRLSVAVHRDPCPRGRTGASQDEVADPHAPRHWTARRMCATKEGAFKLICHQAIFRTLTRYA